MNMSIGRMPWLDALRAMAIILVVFGHEVQWWDEYFVYTSPIKIPLFFIISGYLFNIKGGDTKSFLSGLFRRIVIPYVVLALISAVASIPFTGIQTFPTACLKIISGESYWFMPCLIVGEIIIFFILKYASSMFSSAIISIICFAVGYYLVKQNVLNFGMLNIALEIQFFIYIGTIFRKMDKMIVAISNKLLFFLMVAYILLCYFGDSYNLMTGFDPHSGNYGFLPFSLFVILLGNVVLFGLAPKLANWPRFLLFIGQNTLVLYLWANWGKTVLFGVMRVLHVAKPVHSISFALVCLIASIAFCSICSVILNKYMPALVGKKK